MLAGMTPLGFVEYICMLLLKLDGFSCQYDVISKSSYDRSV